MLPALFLLPSCSPYDGPAPDAPPDSVSQPLPPPADAPADTAPPPTADSQDTYFEGSEQVWIEARQRGITFRAIGQEPGWVLEIQGNRQIRVVTDYGERELVTPVPRPAVDSTTWTTTYHAVTEENDLRIDIRDEPCADTMSGERFSATVTLVLNGTTYRGCGRELDLLP